MSALRDLIAARVAERSAPTPATLFLQKATAFKALVARIDRDVRAECSGWSFRVQDIGRTGFFFNLGDASLPRHHWYSLRISGDKIVSYHPGGTNSGFEGAWNLSDPESAESLKFVSSLEEWIADKVVDELAQRAPNGRRLRAAQ